MYEEYKINDRLAGISGRQKIYRFPNGFGASVINGKRLHSYPFYTEIAVLKFDSEKDIYHLVYDTPITDDVIITGSVEEELDYLKRIKELD